MVPDDGSWKPDTNSNDDDDDDTCADSDINTTVATSSGAKNA